MKLSEEYQLLTVYLIASKEYNEALERKLPLDNTILIGNKYIHALHNLFKNKNAIDKIFDDKELWNQLNEDDKTMVAGMYLDIMEKMLANKELFHLSQEPLSKCISAYSLNLDTLRAACGMFESYGDFAKYPQQATTQQREAICFKIAKQPELVNRLNPTAKLLFLGFLKQSKTEEKEQLKTLSLAMQAEIRAAFTDGIDFDYSQSAIGHWNKRLIPALAGGFGIGDYVGRSNEIYDTAMGRLNVNEVPFTEKAKLHAVIYILDNRYITNHMSYKKLSKNPKYLDDMAAKKLAVAKKHPHIAMLLIKHPELHENVFRGSDMTMESLAFHHGGNVWDAFLLRQELQEKEAEILELRAQLTSSSQSQPVNKGSAEMLAQSMKQVYMTPPETTESRAIEIEMPNSNSSMPKFQN